MGTIYLHVGQQKTGSTSIQRWLGRHAGALRHQGIDPLVVRAAHPPGGPLRVRPFEKGGMNSGALVRRWETEWKRDRTSSPGVDDAIDQIVERAEHSHVVISSEDFWRMLAKVKYRAAPRVIGRLAERAPLMVVAYLRPQHSFLEAYWRQFGFQESDLSPAEHLGRIVRRLRYDRIIQSVRAVRPSHGVVTTVVGSEGVTDAVAHFARLLPLDPTWSTPTEERRNIGLSLDAAVLIHQAPADRYIPRDRTAHAAIDRLKQVDFDWPALDPARTARAGLLLRTWSARHFGAGNRRLARMLDWPEDVLTPAAEEIDPTMTDPDLAELADLWRLPDDVDIDATLRRLDAALGARTG